MIHTDRSLLPSNMFKMAGCALPDGCVKCRRLPLEQPLVVGVTDDAAIGTHAAICRMTTLATAL
jgi:hypothetical protein